MITLHQCRSYTTLIIKQLLLLRQVGTSTDKLKVNLNMCEKERKSHPNYDLTKSIRLKLYLLINLVFLCLNKG